MESNLCAIYAFLESKGTAPLKKGSTLAELIKRPELDYSSIGEIDKERPALTDHEATQAEVMIKYRGYIKKQEMQIERFKRMESRRLPQDVEYAQIDGLRLEARQKLDRIKPLSLGQASRISGVSPADINVLLVWLERNRRMEK